MYMGKSQKRSCGSSIALDSRWHFRGSCLNSFVAFIDILQIEGCLWLRGKDVCGACGQTEN